MTPAFPADPALPTLPEALDPMAMLEVFRRHLGEPAGTRMGECVVSRIRYRRGERAVIQYTVSLDGGHPDQWVTALLYPGDRASRVWRKVARRLPATGQEGPITPAAFAPEVGMVLQVFPFDRRLPSLEVLADPPAEVIPANGRARVGRVEAVRYRAGLSCVLRWDLVDDDARSRWYVKAYRDGQASEGLRLLRALRSGGNRGFEVAEPIAELVDLRAVVQGEVAGTPLGDVLKGAEDPTTPMERVAEALAAFNQSPPVTRRRHGPDAKIGDVRRAGALMGWVLPELAGTVDGIAGSIAERLEPGPLASAHRDLKPDHVLLNAEHVALLDVDSMACADPVEDPAAMLARLEGLAARHPLRSECIDTAAQAFADRYFTRVPGGWRDRLPPHRAAALLEEAAGCFRRQEPRWPQLVETLVARAQRALAATA